MAEIRRMLNTDDIQRIIWLPTELQLANALTKRGANTDMQLDFINSGQIKFYTVLTLYFILVCRLQMEQNFILSIFQKRKHHEI